MIKINIFKAIGNRIRNIPTPWGFTPYDSYNVNYELFIKQAHDNPFINGPFNEFVTDLKSIKLEVHKGNKLSESTQSKFVMKTLDRPNEELSYSDFMHYIALYLVFGGRCLLFKTRGILSRDIHIYSPDSFQIKRNENTLKIESIDLGGTTISGLELENYHLIKTVDPNDKIAGKGSGYSLIKPLAMVGDMLNYLMQHNNSLLKNGGRTSGICQLPQNATKEQVEELKRTFGSQMGVKEAGKVAFIKGEGVSFQAFSTNPKDLDWIQGMIELQKVVCRVMGVPETLIISENSSYNNLEGFKKKIYEDTIIPFANKICEELTYFLRDDLGEGEKIVINTSNIKALQIGISDEIQKWAKALEGKITTNNFIEFINKSFELAIPTLKGEEGNKVLVSANMMFLEDLGVNYEPTPQETVSE